MEALRRATRALATVAPRLVVNDILVNPGNVTRMIDAAHEAVSSIDLTDDRESVLTARNNQQLMDAAGDVVYRLRGHLGDVDRLRAENERERGAQTDRDRPVEDPVERPARAEPADEFDFDAWAAEVTQAVQAAEQAAGEAERAAAGPGTWFERTNACSHARGRYYQASSRVTSLIYENRFLPARGASQAWEQVRGRLDAAEERASAACASIGPPPPAPVRR